MRRVGGIEAASQALGHSDLSTTLGIYGHQDDRDLERAFDQLGEFSTDGRTNRSSRLNIGIGSVEPESGGGGNRTRVRGRTGVSVYKRSLRFRFARRPARRRPTDGLAILWSPASGDWLSLGGKPVC